MFPALHIIPPKHTPKSEVGIFQEKEEIAIYCLPFSMLVKSFFEVLLFLFCWGLLNTLLLLPEGEFLPELYFFVS